MSVTCRHPWTVSSERKLVMFPDLLSEKVIREKIRQGTKGGGRPKELNSFVLFRMALLRIPHIKSIPVVGNRNPSSYAGEAWAYAKITPIGSSPQAAAQLNPKTIGGRSSEKPGETYEGMIANEWVKLSGRARVIRDEEWPESASGSITMTPAEPSAGPVASEFDGVSLADFAGPVNTRDLYAAGLRTARPARSPTLGHSVSNSLPSSSTIPYTSISQNFLSPEDEHEDAFPFTADDVLQAYAANYPMKIPDGATLSNSSLLVSAFRPSGNSSYGSEAGPSFVDAPGSSLEEHEQHVGFDNAALAQHGLPLSREGWEFATSGRLDPALAPVGPPPPFDSLDAHHEDAMSSWSGNASASGQTSHSGFPSSNVGPIGFSGSSSNWVAYDEAFGPSSSTNSSAGQMVGPAPNGFPPHLEPHNMQPTFATGEGITQGPHQEAAPPTAPFHQNNAEASTSGPQAAANLETWSFAHFDLNQVDWSTLSFSDTWLMAPEPSNTVPSLSATSVAPQGLVQY